MKTACFSLFASGLFVYEAQATDTVLRGGLLTLAVVAAVFACVTLGTSRRAVR